MRGKFITIEGTDGSGKSTQIGLLMDYLNKKGVDVLFTREPGGTPIGEKIREIILDVNNREMAPETEALLYAASRSQHVREKIIPAVEEGKIVICDRFVDSSLAYQGAARRMGMETIMEMNRAALGGIMPDLTVFLDLPAAECDRRIEEGRSSREIFEKLETIKAIRGKYLEVFERIPDHNVKIIDASGSPETVSKRIIEAVKESIPL